MTKSAYVINEWSLRKMMMTPRTSGPATLGPLGSGSTPSLTPKDDKGKKLWNDSIHFFFIYI